MIPSRGASKGPCVRWKAFQKSLPTPKDIENWDSRFKPERWGFITGEFSTIIGIDFDGERGIEWMNKWGLKPNLHSGSGGFHVYVQHPGWYVPTLNARTSKKTWPFPGVDVRGDGGFIVLIGSNKNGPYNLIDNQIRVLPADEMPEELRLYLWSISKSNPDAKKEEIPEDQSEDVSEEVPSVPASTIKPNGHAKRPDSSSITDRALTHPSGTGRNNDGFNLACQLRDNGYSESETISCLLNFQSRAPSVNARGEREAYTKDEAIASARSAFMEPPRDPWTPRSGTRDPQRDSRLQPPPTNGDAALHASAPLSDVSPDQPVEIDYDSHLEAEVVRIIAAKDVFECYKNSFIELCVKAGHKPAFLARERLRQAYPNPGGLVLKGTPGAWDVRYKEEVDRQAALVEVKPDLAPMSSWQSKLILTDKGKQAPCYENAALHAENSPDWMGVLGYNEFTAGHVVLEAGPYPITAKPGEEIEDHFDTEVTRWFERRGLLVKPEVARRTVDRMARLNAFHPVRDYLNGLPEWDGTRRIATWLIDYCKVSPTVLNEKDEAVPNIFAMEAGARFLISAVARIFQPGCKADHVLMLEGKTGIGKSTTVQILAGEEYFTDQLSDLGSKDASMQIRGIWIVEIAELHALSKSDRENAKKFVSQQFERFRLPYGKRLTKFQRQCVFIGTTENSEWNTDERGARRFWPVLCEGPIDTEGIKRDRDQFWAEALDRFRRGDKWHIYKPEAVKAAEEVQSSRYAVDVWQDKVIQQAEIISRLPDSRRSAAIPEILSAMGVDTPRQDQLQANRVGRCLRFSKWERKQVREGKTRTWRWFAPPEPTPSPE